LSFRRSSPAAPLPWGTRRWASSREDFFFTDGTLRTNYHAPFEAVWTACVQALRNTGAKEIMEERKISKGTISGTIAEDKVDIFVEYAE
jgi:hypothetical protein